MLFCSPQFCLFFLVLFFTYWILPWHKARVYLLLAASFYFYACWDYRLAFVLSASTLMDYLIARAMEKWSAARPRKLLLLASLVMNLGLLCWFKYMNFFLRSLETAAGAANLHLSLPVLQVILPIGISFYTFEAINYTVDVYTRKIRAERNLAHFMLFILFFPHLVAGPIVRARDFLPQVARRKRWSWRRANAGAWLILIGLFKKLAIADRMALYVDPVFAGSESYGSHALWLATIAYALQVYCDFSGYTDMALGLAHLLGYHLAPNFNLPYLSANIGEFWRRWHISLSSWLRDYLFIPLGGSRGGRWRTCRNLMVVMLLGGLWHGASWTFVAWGLLHGALLIGHRAWQRLCQGRPWLDRVRATTPGKALCIATTFACVCAGWVLFRAPTITAAGQILYRLAIPSGGQEMPMHLGGLYLTFAFVALCHFLGDRERWVDLWEYLPLWLRGLSFGTAATLALIVAPNASKAFIYFQF